MGGTLRVLGVNIGHDSSAAIVDDGKIVADVAEERFIRIKHYSGLPLRSIEYCLKAAGVTLDEVDVVAVPTAGKMPDLNHLFELPLQRQEHSKFRLALNIATRITNTASVKMPLYVKRFPLKNSIPIVHVNHHLAHAASAYYTCGSSGRQLILTMDGIGDGSSVCLYRGEAGKIEPLKIFPAGASLGWFYSNVTEALGWWHGDGEGKTMGLAPYGDPSKVRGSLDAFHPKYGNGDLLESHDYGRIFFWNEIGAVQWHLEESAEIRELIGKHGRENIAAEAQRVLEEQTGRLLFPWLEREGTRNLCCSGGIFLNVKLNQRIWESGRVDGHHIYPNPGDSGLAVGAALHAYHRQNPGSPIGCLDTLFLGPEYSDDEIERVLKARNLSYRRVEEPASFAAGLLAEDRIVAWFQGRMESGPRALGNRSILMSANRRENKDILNARVKFREAFRPFCPSLLWERKEEYLENPRDEFFMITSFTCREEKRGRVPAVVHADATLRPQTVKREHNPGYWDLIRRFGELTGEPLVLNTSFNIMGEPIVNHPREAIRCFFDNGLDHLVMGSFVLSK